MPLHMRIVCDETNKSINIFGLYMVNNKFVFPHFFSSLIGGLVPSYYQLQTYQKEPSNPNASIS